MTDCPSGVKQVRVVAIGGGIIGGSNGGVGGRTNYPVIGRNFEPIELVR